VLIYGAAGNGKTSIAEALVSAFEQPVYIPTPSKKTVRSSNLRSLSPCDLSDQHGADANGGLPNPILLPHLAYDPRWVRLQAGPI